MRIFGAAPLAPRPIRSGLAISSPSRSRPVTSASTTSAAARPAVAALAAALGDRAFVGELAQHALERGAVGVLQAEGARDLALADFAGLLAR